MMFQGRRRAVALALAAALIAAGCTSDGEPAQTAPTPTDTSVGLDTAAVATTTAPPTSTAPTTSSTGGDAVTTPPTTSDIEYLLEEERLAVPNQPSQYVIGLYGDSLFDSAREHVLFALNTGVQANVRHNGIFSGSSLCNFLTLMNDDIDSGDLWGVVIWFSGNNLAECSYADGERTFDPVRLIADMEAHLMTLGARYEEHGIHVWLPTFPLSRTGDFSGESLAPDLNAMVTRVADAFAVVEVVDVAAAVLDENGRYTETLPCLPIEPCLMVDEDGNGVNFVREADGTHFCTGTFKGAGLEDARWGTCPTYSSGVLRISLAMTKPIVEAAYSEWSADPASQDPPVTLPDIVG